MKSIKVGKVGLDYTTEEGAEMAKIIALELLATLKHELGSPACEQCPWLRGAGRARRSTREHAWPVERAVERRSAAVAACVR